MSTRLDRNILSILNIEIDYFILCKLKYFCTSIIQLLLDWNFKRLLLSCMLSPFLA